MTEQNPIFTRPAFPDFSPAWLDVLCRIGADRNLPIDFRNRLLSSASWYAVTMQWRRL